jgi:uncharacterized protein YecT (DUF1311 family)
MKTALAVVMLCSPMLVRPPVVHGRSPDPRRHAQSNAEEGKCYAREQARINTLAETLAKKFASEFRKAASDDDSRGDTIIARLERKTSEAIVRSQDGWRSYRDEQCKSVQYSYTTGSGAGTAYEACMFDLGQKRVRELRRSFGNMGFSH